MGSKIIYLAFIWCAIIVAYIFLAAVMPAMNEIISTANASLVASANMSNFPGTQEAVETAPVWLWAIPGIVGVVSTAILLKRKS